MNPDQLWETLETLGVRKLRRGHGNIHACCPNPGHQENNPSWGISTTEPHFHGCFGCGFKGTLFDLLLRVGKFTPMEARRLANIQEASDLKLPGLQAPSVSHVLPSVIRLYPFRLTQRALVYLRSRGVPPAVAKATGCLHHHHDQRVLFPWYWNGVLVGVTGRTLVNDKAKVLPYFGTLKGHWLYAPVGTITRGKRLVLVEGEVDALKVYASGERNVCALSFSSFTVHQENLLLNSRPSELVLFFDDDDAGERITQSVIKRLSGKMRLSQVKYGRFIPRYRGKLDPGSLSRADIARALSTEVRKNCDFRF